MPGGARFANHMTIPEKNPPVHHSSRLLTKEKNKTEREREEEDYWRLMPDTEAALERRLCCCCCCSGTGALSSGKSAASAKADDSRPCQYSSLRPSLASTANDTDSWSLLAPVEKHSIQRESLAKKETKKIQTADYLRWTRTTADCSATHYNRPPSTGQRRWATDRSSEQSVSVDSGATD